MKRKCGHYVETTTSRERVRAFVPAPLPPKPPLELTPAIQPLLVEARHGLEKLNIATRLIPSPDWFLYGFVRKEAVISSQIEGTQASLMDLVAAEGSDAVASPDVEEMCNYVDAVNFAWGQLRSKKGLPLSLRLLKEAHARLMRGSRGERKTPGEFRRTQNWIGGSRPGNAVFVPPPPTELSDCLAQFEKFLHADTGGHPLVRAALAHAQFESIHPFLDGNGRIGRLLIVLMLGNEMVIDAPVLYLSLFFKMNRAVYYERLNAVREGDWEGWVEFFLRGICEVSDDAVRAAATLHGLFREHRTAVINHRQSTVIAARLMEALPHSPRMTIADAVQRLGITKPPTIKAVNLLVGLGILTEVTGRKKDRVFEYRKYLDVLAAGTETR